MKKQETYMTDLICSNCGNIMTIPVKKGKVREKYHVKDMYCFRCNRETKFIELIDVDIIKKELDYKEELNDEEKLVYNLLHKESDVKVLCKKKNIWKNTQIRINQKKD